MRSDDDEDDDDRVCVCVCVYLYLPSVHLLYIIYTNSNIFEIFFYDVCPFG